MSDIVRGLINAGWDFSIQSEKGVISICVWRPEWVTDHRPEGKGRTLREAYEDLGTANLCPSNFLPVLRSEMAEGEG